MKSIDALLSRTLTFILAGGRGERLLPLTRHRCKPMVPFGGVGRIVDFTLSNCRRSRLNPLVVLTQYQSEALHDHVRREWARHQCGSAPVCRPPARGAHYRGTADAVFQNLDVLDGRPIEHVLILAADHIYAMDYRGLLAHHEASGGDLTIAAVEQPQQHSREFGILEVGTDGRVVGFEEKPVHPRPMPTSQDRCLASMGIYVFRTRALRDVLKEHRVLGPGQDFGRDILPMLIGSRPVFAYNFGDAYWRDLGTLDAYYRASMDFLDWTRSDAGRKPGRVVRSVAPAGVTVSPDAEVLDSILMPGTRIGSGARVRHAIIEEGIRVPDGAEIGLNLQEDQDRFQVTPGGVIVVDSESVLSGTLPQRVAARVSAGC